jgi:hypothetical protein
VDSRYRTYHRTLFQWHCRHFFNFRRHLSAVEKLYLEECFALADTLSEVSEGGYAHFSYYTYSHRVKGDSVNSSRIAYGSVNHPEAAWAAARRVIEKRAIQLPAGLADDNPFYGLGWDIEEGLFKVYFRTLDWRRLPPSLADLVVDYNWNEHRPEALLSLTWAENRVVERKVYLYPIDQVGKQGVQGQARMITDARGEVIQEDLLPDGVIPYDLNDTGKRILALYEEIGEPLDTIAYKGPQDFTLYFP